MLTMRSSFFFFFSLQIFSYNKKKKKKPPLVSSLKKKLQQKVFGSNIKKWKNKNTQKPRGMSEYKEPATLFRNLTHTHTYKTTHMRKVFT